MNKLFVIIIVALFVLPISSCQIYEEFTACLVDGRTDYVSHVIKNASCDEPTSGSIDQQWCTPIPVILNPHYTWNNGATTEDISGIAPNYPSNYTCKINYTPISGMHASMPLQQYDVLYDTQWELSGTLQYNDLTEIISNTASVNGVLSSSCSRNILPANGLGFVEFKVNLYYMHSNEAYLGFDNAGVCSSVSNITTTFNGIVFNVTNSSATCRKVRNGVPIGPTYTFQNGDLFRIQYANGLMFRQNNIPIGSITTGLSFTHPELILRSAIGRIGISFQDVNSTFACSKPADYYAELTKEIDGQCYTMTNSVKFKYREKYEDNILNYTIYNWKREAIVSSSSVAANTANSNTDNNYHIIPIGGRLANDEVYTLEVKNDKGEIYKMRFRYLRIVGSAEFFAPPAPGTIGVTRPTYVGPTNVDPFIKASVNINSGLPVFFQTIHDMDYE